MTFVPGAALLVAAHLNDDSSRREQISKQVDTCRLGDGANKSVILVFTQLHCRVPGLEIGILVHPLLAVVEEQLVLELFARRLQLFGLNAINACRLHTTHGNLGTLRLFEIVLVLVGRNSVALAQVLRTFPPRHFAVIVALARLDKLHLLIERNDEAWQPIFLQLRCDREKNLQFNEKSNSTHSLAAPACRLF